MKREPRLTPGLSLHSCGLVEFNSGGGLKFRKGNKLFQACKFDIVALLSSIYLTIAVAVALSLLSKALPAWPLFSPVVVTPSSLVAGASVWIRYSLAVAASRLRLWICRPRVASELPHAVADY